MNKAMAEEIAGIFTKIGIIADAKPRTGKPRSWAVTFLLKPEKKEAFEDIMIDFSNLKLKVEYEPHGVSMERVFLY